MKKLTTIAICLVLMGSMMLVGCEKKESTPKETPVPTATAGAEAGNSEKTPSATPEAAKDTEKNESVSVKTSPVVQRMVDEAKSGIADIKASLGNAMDVDISARGNSIVYTYTYLIDIGDISTAKKALEAGMDTQKAVFEGIVTVLKAEKVSSPSVIIEYISKDDKMIYSKEFK